MRRLYVTLFILLACSSLAAQDLVHSRRSSYYTFIYKISNKHAEALYKNMWNLENTFLTDLFDTFPSDSAYTKKLPVGHFAFVKTINGNLHCELQSVNNVGMTLLNNHRDLILVFNDSQGNELQNVMAAVRSRKIPFDNAIHAYRLRKSSKRGLVSADYQGHVSFFQIDRRYNNTFFVRTAKKLSHTFPVNHIISPAFYLYNNIRSISYGGGVSAPGFYHRFIRIFKPKQRNGYIVLNKPKFRPDDTVRVKGFLTTRKGKPLRKAVDLYLYRYYPDEYAKKLASASPFRKGAYQFEFQLADTLRLKLDHQYMVQFRDSKGNILLSTSFDYEDYELKQNTYSVRSEQRAKGKPATLFLRGEDSNAMPLFDVRAEILLKPRNVNRYDAQEVFVPDTLWFYQTRLEATGETKVSIPDSAMPPASLGYEALVSFFNTENERTVKTLQLDYRPGTFPISVQVINDSIKVKSTVPKISMKGSVTVIWSNEALHLSGKEIVLPHTEKVNRFADSFTVAYSADESKQTEEIDFGEVPDQLRLLAQRTADSLFVATENPRRIPFKYFLFRNRSLIESGETESLSLTRKANPSDGYTLSVQYIWAGRSETREYAIAFDKRNLDITLEHPSIIYPGQQASFKITVKDANGDPVENVDLTAYAITKKFQDVSPPSIPSFKRNDRGRVVFNEFFPREHHTTVSQNLDWTYWRKTLGLDSIAFYRFLFPDSGYFEHRLQADVAQIAPFVVSRGDVLSAEVIYVDGQPVYYEGVSTLEPYSFQVTPGIHTIDLRLFNQQITIRDVRIEEGQKLIFSIDSRHLPANSTSTEMPSRLSEDELKKLGRYFMVLRSPSQLSDGYLSQGNTYRLLGKEHNVYGYSPRERLAGPFYPGEMTYAEASGLSHAFNFEPFWSYEFTGNTLRQRQTNMAKYMKAALSWTTDVPPFDQTVQTLKSIEAYWNYLDELSAFSFRRFPEFEPAAGKIGRLTLAGVPLEAKNLLPRAVFLVNLDNPDDYSIFPETVTNAPLLSGRYQAVVIFSDEQYLKVDSLEIKPYGLNYYDVTSLKLHEPDTFSNHVLQTIRKWSKEGNYLTKERQQDLQRARQFLYQQSSSTYSFNHVVTGRIRASTDGEPLPGVNVIIKGTAIGTVSDVEGYYRISCPPNATLVFSFIGFVGQEVPVSSQPNVDVDLDEDIQQLNEVVVVGMGLSTGRRHMAASVVTQLSGRLPGIAVDKYKREAQESAAVAIRGVSGVEPDAAPLIVLDGAVVRLQDVDHTRVTAIEILKGSEATALYGSRASNGVILMSTQPGATRKDLLEFTKSMVNVAALEAIPGNELRQNFRDYAFWKPTLVTDADGRADFTATFPDDITGWNAHVLGVGSKRRTGQTSSGIRSYKPVLAQIAQPRFLVEGDSSNAIGKITNYLPEQIVLKRSIRINEQPDSAQVTVKDSSVDSIRLFAAGTDTISVYYSVSYDDYTDGELRKLPVYRRGTKEAVGEFIPMTRDTSFTLTFNPEDGKVSIYAQADLLDVLVDEINFLKDYEYECNEQLASRLRALLLEKKIHTYKDQKFKNEREILKVIRKLVSHQNKDGSWSWWDTGEGSTWVTVHVAGALEMAEKEGLPVAVDKQSLINYLEINLSNLLSKDRLHVRAYLLEQGEKLAIPDTLHRRGKGSLYEKLLAQRLLQLSGKTPDWAWINEQKSHTIKGNPYWGEERSDLFDNSVLNTLVVYKMIHKENPLSEELTNITNYFLEQRRRHWRNTFESSLILEAVLPTLLTKKEAKTKPVLRLTGPVNEIIESFPFTATVDPTTSLSVSKSGMFPVYFTTYQERWNAGPSRHEGDFVVRTAFEGKPPVLKTGRTVNLMVEVEVKKDAEYVMIEVPVPAGCSYGSKVRSRANGEVHREYYSHKTNIYCEYLKKGTYMYTIPLLPRYSGTYTINPAVAECMYFPVIYGREAVKRVRVE